LKTTEAGETMNHSQQSTPPSKLTFTLVGHNDTIDSLAFLPDGRTVASASFDSTKFWDVATGRELRTFEYDDEYECVYVRCLSPNGKCFVTVDATSTIRFRDMRDDHLIRDPFENPSLIREGAFSDDGSTFAFSDRDDKVTVLSVTSNAEPRVFDACDYLDVPIALSPNGRFLAIGDRVGNGVRVLEVATGNEVHIVTGKELYVYNIAFSPDGLALATAGSETTKLWELSTGRELCSFATDGGFSSLAFSPDGRWVASGDEGPNRTTLHDATSGRRCGSLSGHHIAFSKDGSRIATGSRHEEIQVVNAGTGEEISAWAGHDAAVLCVAISPDGQTIATGGMDNAIKIWDMRTGREVRTLGGHRDGVRSIAFSADANMLASIDGSDAGRFWDVSAARITRTVLDDQRYVIAFSTDLRLMFWSSPGDNLIRTEELATGREIYTVRYDYFYNPLVVSPDGRFAAAGINDGVVAWDLDTGKHLCDLNLRDRWSRRPKTAISFSPDGQLLAIGCDDGRVMLLNLSTGKVAHVINTSSDLHSLSFSADGRFLAVSCPSVSGTRLWEVETGQKLNRLPYLDRAVFSLDGRLLIGTRAVHTVRLWQ